jgi:hypothetical protein
MYLKALEDSRCAENKKVSGRNVSKLSRAKRRKGRKGKVIEYLPPIWQALITCS